MQMFVISIYTREYIDISRCSSFSNVVNLFFISIKSFIKFIDKLNMKDLLFIRISSNVIGLIFKRLIMVLSYQNLHQFTSYFNAYLHLLTFSVCPSFQAYLPII